MFLFCFIYCSVHGVGGRMYEIKRDNIKPSADSQLNSIDIIVPQSSVVSPQEKVLAYAKISDRMTSSQDNMTLYDAESPPIAYQMEEAELASDIENLLTQVLSFSCTILCSSLVC